jgi:catechol 2,3-dioxygenase-like lactoylglutathione lyase family enzyme
MHETGPLSDVRGLDHVGLNVPDLEEAVAFFVEVLGAQVLFRMDRFSDPEGGAMQRLGAPRSARFELAMLSLGTGRLELLRWWCAEQRTDPPRSSDIGGSHVAIEVANVAAAFARLGTIPGVTVLGEPVTFGEGPTPGLTNAFVTTPWGALLELVNWGQTD